MAITHRVFVLITFPLCCASVALLVTSLATRSWYEGTSTYPSNVTSRKNSINYGLFVGTYINRFLPSPKTYDIYLTCLSDEGVCAWSCLDTVALREQQVEDLLETGISNEICATVNNPQVIPSQLLEYSSHQPNYFSSKAEQHENLDESLWAMQLNEGYFPVDQKFISLAIWASTIAFLSFAILMAAVGAAFAVVNTAGNPVEPILGVPGLYIWNATSVVAIIVALALWGSQFATTLISNAVLADTITGNTSSNGLGTLGYSYWLLLVAGILHLVNIGLLLYRRHLILTEPPAPTIHMEEDRDGAIFLY